MRIDKFLSENGIASRKEAAQAARKGQIALNGIVIKDTGTHMNPETDTLVFCGNVIMHAPKVYVMLHKPTGYVSATEDGHLPTVLDLLPTELQKRGLFPCGRLDKDTTGLILLTNDGTLSHYLLSPSRHVAKRYAFTCAEPLTPHAEQAFMEGMTLGNGDELLSAELFATPDRMGGEILLREGKYHQIKRMLGALGNRIVTLHRVSFGPLTLPLDLPEGKWRHLTESEVLSLHEAVGK